MEETILDAIVADAPAAPTRGRHYSTFVLLVAVVSLAALVVGATNIGRAASALRVRRWNSVPGTIMTSAIKLDTAWFNIPPRYARVMTVERFHVAYAYSFNGVSYTTTRFDALTPAGADLPHARQRQYPVGAIVNLRVDPTHPGHAVLEAPFPMVSLFGGILELLVGALLVRWSWRECRRADDA